MRAMAWIASSPTSTGAMVMPTSLDSIDRHTQIRAASMRTAPCARATHRSLHPLASAIVAASHAFAPDIHSRAATIAKVVASRSALPTNEATAST